MVVDGLASDLDISLPVEELQWSDLELPFLVALRDELVEAPAGGENFLWDGAYYEKFWSSYDRFSRKSPPAALVESEHLAIGPISLQQVFLEALPFALGHKDRLQLHFPVSGRLLFGRADGWIQTDLKWLDDQALVTAGMKFTLEDFQAGALGLATRGEHVPFVEDQFFSKVFFSTKDFPLNRDTLQTLFIDPGMTEGFDRFDAAVTIRRSGPHMASVPGILQMSTDMRINTMRELLDRVVGMRLSGPPQSVSYRDFHLNFKVDQGEILTEPLLMELGGLQILSSEKLDVEGKFRVHWKRQERTMPAYDFRSFLSSLQSLLPASAGE